FHVTGVQTCALPILTTMEFCVALGLHSPHDGVTCRDESFVGLARKDPAVALDTVFFLNGAYGGQVGTVWDEPEEPNYDRISQERSEERRVGKDRVSW